MLNILKREPLTTNRYWCIDLLVLRRTLYNEYTWIDIHVTAVLYTDGAVTKDLCNVKKNKTVRDVNPHPTPFLFFSVCTANFATTHGRGLVQCSACLFFLSVSFSYSPLNDFTVSSFDFIWHLCFVFINSGQSSNFLVSGRSRVFFPFVSGGFIFISFQILISHLTLISSTAVCHNCFIVTETGRR